MDTAKAVKKFLDREGIPDGPNENQLRKPEEALQNLDRDLVSMIPYAPIVTTALDSGPVNNWNYWNH